MWLDDPVRSFRRDTPQPKLLLNMLWIIVAAAGLLAFSNGANDNFKGFATVWGAHALGYRQALILATAATLAGSLASLTATFLLSLLDYPVSRCVGQRIARAAAAAGIPHQDIASDQVGDIAQRRVGRGLGQRRPLRCRQLALEPVQQPVQHLALAIVEGLSAMGFPEMRLTQDRAESSFRAVERPIQAGQEPFQPGRDVEVALLRAFEQVVIGFPLLPDLRRHAVEPLRTLVRARQAHVRDGARNPAVAILERVDGHEP